MAFEDTKRTQLNDANLQPGKPPKLRKPAQGRLGRDKQEAVIRLDKLKEMAPTVLGLYRVANDANKDLNEAIKATAEQSGLLASVVRSYITASAGHSFKEKSRHVEQLELVFELGEVRE